MKALKNNIKSFLNVTYADESALLRQINKTRYFINGGWSTVIDVRKRSKTDIFDYKALARPLKFYPYVPIDENNLYGNGYNISNKLNIDLKVTTIEHGLYIGSLVPARHLLSFYENIITFSDYRKDFLKSKTDKNIITVGPYIKYADSLYSHEYITSNKKKLGKTLVVFPSHSIDSIYAQYDIKCFIKYISEFQIKHDFDSVLICLYWKDIALSTDKQYVDTGFDVLTAGHIYDPFFLNRLKTILLLADGVLTNAVGTHVGYAITMDKPIKIWTADKVKYLPLEGNETQAIEELNMRKGLDLKSQLSAVNHIEKIFSDFNGVISQEQKDCVRYYWGD